LSRAFSPLKRKNAHEVGNNIPVHGRCCSKSQLDLLDGMIMWPDNMNQNAWYFLYIQEATNSHFHVKKEDGIHETWTELIVPRNWRALERPYSMPWDIGQ